MTPALFALALLSHRADPLDRWVETRMARDHIPGLALGVYRDGRPVKVRAYGTIDLEHGIPARKDSPFEICSITKQFTAVAVLLLAEDGKLGLDDPLTRWFPGADPSWREIRLADVLHHMSGLPDLLSEPGGFERPWSDVARDYPGRKAVAPPRTAWEYNNGAYSLLGEVVTKASGEPLWTFVKRRILDPLGLRHTFPNSSAMQPGRVRGYTWNGKGFVDERPLDAGYAAGALVSTPDDLARWSEALRRGTLLKPASRVAMLRPARLDSGEEAVTFLGGGYGLGVFVSRVDGRTVEMHSGGWDGASAQLTRLPDDGLTVVVLTNRGGLDERAWWGAEIAEIVTDRRILPSFEAATTDPDAARTARARAIVEETAKGGLGPLRRIGFIRADRQGAATLLQYRAEFDAPSVATFVERGGKLELTDLSPVPRP